MFGLLARHMWPLAIMPSADQVPVKRTHSKMRWPEWVVLIARSTGSAFVLFALSNRHITPDTRRDPFQTLSAAGCL